MWSKGRGLAGSGLRAPLAVVVVTLFVAVFPLVSSEFTIFLASLAGAYLLVTIGLNLSHGYTGLVSAGQGALMAVGAYTAALLTVDHGWSFWAAALAGGLIAAVCGAIVVLPAFRVSGWYFAMMTLILAVVVQGMLFELDGITHGSEGVVGVQPPSIADYVFGPRDMFWLICAINLAAWLVMRNVVSSRLGRGLVAVRDAPLMAAMNGVRVGVTKVAVFALAAFLAGLGGALFSVLQVVITPDDFGVELSFFFIVVVTLGGAGTLLGPVAGVIAFAAIPEYLTGLAQYRYFIYGGALLVGMTYLPGGIVGGAEQWLRDRRETRRRQRVNAKGAAQSSSLGGHAQVESMERLFAMYGQGVDGRGGAGGASLEVRGVTKRFGGVAALDGVDLTVAPGAVHGISGPNGSGKTTLLNLICGFYRVDGGHIALDGKEITGSSPRGTALHGIARTFQTPQLLHSLSVIDNVKLGAYSRESGTTLGAVLRSPAYRAGSARSNQEAREWLEFVGLDELAEAPAAGTPHGQQRLLEIARAMMSHPRLLLLDEPAAGLSESELDELCATVVAIRRVGVSVVLVEHHVDVIQQVADEVTVLDHGTVLASGDPLTTFDSPEVLTAYMGLPVGAAS